MIEYATPAECERLLHRLRERSTCVDACLIIDGFKDRDGYGLSHFKGRQRKAHRAAFLANNGYLDSELLVLHSCDTPDCCADAHLRQGTNLDNHTDKNIRYRQEVGEGHGRHKLTREQVLEIKALYDARSANGLSCEAIAAMYGCESSHVSRIGLGQTRFGGRVRMSSGVIL